jgi:hypothetical protein
MLTDFPISAQARPIHRIPCFPRKIHAFFIGRLKSDQRELDSLSSTGYKSNDRATALAKIYQTCVQTDFA